MQIELERSAYGKLVEWKKNAGHSTLEVSGARQVGKTYLVNKFADKEYRQKIYINLLELSGELFLNDYKELWQEMKHGKRYENPVYELIRRYEPSFKDSPDTVVIIDEIQESAEIYNRIREFTRQLSSDFIITGSYLGRVLNKEFKYSSGDLDSIEIQTLSFEEFLLAMGKWELYDHLDLYGGSKETVYKELGELYQIYCTIGGYPAVVLSYLDQKDIQKCQAVLEKIVHLFANESRRYFEDILEAANLRLRRMTGGRYELSRVEEAGDGRSKDSLEIRVMDYYTGKYRSVKTLSGGESFKASLSLALGMSDVIQAESGGIRVEALFIDEGFGALDSESLDQACSALMGLVESDRMIGIISHVPELQERISSQIFIEKKNTGSRIHS